MDGQRDSTVSKPENEIFIEIFNNCALCGSQLDFKHEVDLITFRIIENASCSSCHVPLKAREHDLQ